jgi:hypothetical protein
VSLVNEACLDRSSQTRVKVVNTNAAYSARVSAQSSNRSKVIRFLFWVPLSLFANRYTHHSFDDIPTLLKCAFTGIYYNSHEDPTIYYTDLYHLLGICGSHPAVEFVLMYLDFRHS